MVSRRLTPVWATLGQSRAVTLVELVMVCSIVALLAAAVVPAAAQVQRAVGAAAAARELAVVMRTAQARAQAEGVRVRVTVAPDGGVVVARPRQGTWESVVCIALPTRTTSNYPDGTVEFAPQGWPCAPGSPAPRAGTFKMRGVTSAHTVTLQLSGCVRWR